MASASVVDMVERRMASALVEVVVVVQHSNLGHMLVHKMERMQHHKDWRFFFVSLKSKNKQHFKERKNQIKNLVFRTFCCMHRNQNSSHHSMSSTTGSFT